MNLWNETKSVPVSREMVWVAYKKVKANKGSAGVDEISMEEFDAVRERMKDYGLELHSEKTKLVYCKDYRRCDNYPVVKFDFLGYSFQPRTTKSKKTRKLFLGYDCAISISSKKRIADKMEELNIVGLTHKSIVGVAQFLNPYIRGWVNYYGKFRKHEMNPVFQLLRKRLVRWARKGTNAIKQV